VTSSRQEKNGEWKGTSRGPTWGGKKHKTENEKTPTDGKTGSRFNEGRKKRHRRGAIEKEKSGTESQRSVDFRSERDIWKTKGKKSCSFLEKKALYAGGRTDSGKSPGSERQNIG